MNEDQGCVSTEEEIPSSPWVMVEAPKGKLRTRVVDVRGQSILIASSPSLPEVPIVRFHSSCVFGESFHAIDCDCGAQLDASIDLILSQGGLIVYAWEEGRGTGIADKIRAIALQQSEGVSTSAAFERLGYPPDPRTFDVHIDALRQVYSGVRIRFASNNPKKVEAMRAAGYEVERVRLEIKMTPERSTYLEHKRLHLGHLDDA